MDDGGIRLLEDFAMAYIGGDLPDWFYLVWLTLQTVALYKTADQIDVRPLGLRNSLIKLFHKEVMAQSVTEIREFLEPCQLGKSKAAAAKLVMSVRGTMETNRDFICVRTDLSNAFNSIRRAAILEVLESEPSLRHLSSFSGLIPAPETAMETRGGGWQVRGWYRAIHLVEIFLLLDFTLP